MYTLAIFLVTVIAIFLIIMVLMQSSKGGGLAGTFGGGNMGSMFGTRRTADFLSRATWWLGGSLAALALIVNLFLLPGKTNSAQIESVIQKGKQVPTTPSVPRTNNQQVPPGKP
jgi:preprotein translocase subunit SecG